LSIKNPIGTECLLLCNNSRQYVHFGC